MLFCSVIFSQDLYVLAALVFLALNATQNAAMKSLAYTYQMKEVKIYDRNSIASLAVIFTFFHIIFGIYIAFTVRIYTYKRYLYFNVLIDNRHNSICTFDCLGY